MKRIAILIHANDSMEDGPPYLMRDIARFWREQGNEVVVLRGVKTHADVDLLIMHLDLTMVPQEYIDFAEQYPKVLNGRVTDISKRHISRSLVQAGDGYDGPVIVKTNWNYGGLPEFRSIKRNPIKVVRKLQRYRDRITWRWRTWLNPEEYPQFNSTREVPQSVWRNPNLVVERLLTEKFGDDYVRRTWVFLGDREFMALSYSNTPVIKATTTTRREFPNPDIPDEIRQRRAELGFDFGKFDFLLCDGKPVLFDANRTPAMHRVVGYERDIKMRFLSEGLRSFV